MRGSTIYAIISAALLVLGLLLFTYTLVDLVRACLAWGAGLAIHGLVVFTHTEQDWTEHNATAQWWRDNWKPELALAQGAHATAIGAGARDASGALAKREAKRRTRFDEAPDLHVRTKHAED